MMLTLPEIEVPIDVAGYFEKRCQECKKTPSGLAVKDIRDGFPEKTPQATISAFLKQWKQDVKPSGGGKAAELKALKADSECLQAIRKMVADFNAEPQNYDSESMLENIHAICTEGLSDDDGTQND